MSNRVTGRTLLALLVAVPLGVLTPGSAQAAGGLRLCVPRAEGRSILTPVKGACRSHYVLRDLGAEGRSGNDGRQGAEGRQGGEGKAGPEGKAGLDGAGALTAEEDALLKALIGHVEFLASGIGGKPTIRFTGVNVQILNGAGRTETTNGAGNLIIGYDAEPGEQSGSHNLVLGIRQRYSSYGDILGGIANDATGPFSTVFGAENSVSGAGSSVTGGYRNGASNAEASVSGGSGNVASGSFAAVSGGSESTAEGDDSAVAGGFHNLAGAANAAVSGGANGEVSGVQAWLGGGLSNLASGSNSSVSGGSANIASGPFASILGGQEHSVSSEFGHFP